MKTPVLQSHNTYARGPSVTRYVLLPGILPRISRLIGSGFTGLAYFIALIFMMVSIFPQNHPYAYPQNYRRYGLIAVLAEGSARLKWQRQHFDQILVYFMILGGFIALLLQFTLLILAFFSPQVMASNLIEVSGDFNYLFTPHLPAQDYALRFLDMVFGLKNFENSAGFFESCLYTTETCLDPRGNEVPPYTGYPSPSQMGMHAMIAFYNYMIIGIAFIIFIYYIVTLSAETSTTGTYLGERANKTWIPLRIIFFAALIMPIFQGFNTAQILTLNAAYYGTGIASNAWRQVFTDLNGNITGHYQQLIAAPDKSKLPNSTNVIEFMSMVKTCQYTEQSINNRKIDAYIVRDAFGEKENCAPLLGTTFESASEFSNHNNITIRFGERIPYNGMNAPELKDIGKTTPCSETDINITKYAPSAYGIQRGYVIPHCGEITFKGVAPMHTAGINNLSEKIHKGHYETFIKSLWVDSAIEDIAKGFTDLGRSQIDSYDIDLNEFRDLVQKYNNEMHAYIADSVQEMVESDGFSIEESLVNCGWMCASLYYNRIAEANGNMQSAVFDLPTITKWPRTIDTVINKRNLENQMSTACDMFNPILSTTKTVSFPNEKDLQVASIISSVHEYFCNNDFTSINFIDEGNDAFRYTQEKLGASPFKDAIALMFGLNGLFELRKHTDIHPLAQLSLLGKGMVESTLRAFGGAVLGTIAPLLGLEKSLGEAGSAILGGASGIMMTLGMIGLTIGFILFYVLPILPFVYFIFAVGSWVKGIFEAMVGVPLWALAHLRIDGEGMMGEAASSGYWMILAILIRPILILAGFIASVTIFMAMVKLLNDSFDLVIENVGGFAKVDPILPSEGGVADPVDVMLRNYRGPVDQFFYTVIYAIIVYMMANSSFKLIDTIPDQIMRWANSDAKNFGEFDGDPASGLMDRIGSGIMTATVLGGGLLGSVGGKHAAPVKSASTED